MQRPDRRHVRRGRAGDAGEENLGDDDHLPESTAHAPHDHHGQIHDALRDPRRLHERAAQDEEGHGEQDERVHARQHPLRNHAQGHTTVEE